MPLHFHHHVIQADWKSIRPYEVLMRRIAPRSKRIENNLLSPADVAAHLDLPRYTRPMDRLWTPWRYSYITRADPEARTGVPAALSAWPPFEADDKHCIFCNMIAAVDYAVAHGMSCESAEQ